MILASANAMINDAMTSTIIALPSPARIDSGVTPVTACHGLRNSGGEYHAKPTAIRMTAATSTAHQLIGSISPSAALDAPRSKLESTVIGRNIFAPGRR